MYSYHSIIRPKANTSNTKMATRRAQAQGTGTAPEPPFHSPPSYLILRLSLIGDDSEPIPDRAEAIYYFGDIAGLFFALHGFYNHITRAMELMESDALEKVKKDIISVLQEDAKKLIELYAGLKRGRPLDIVRHELSIVATGLRVYVYKTISYLEESTNDFVIRWIMTKGFD